MRDHVSLWACYILGISFPENLADYFSYCYLKCWGDVYASYPYRHVRSGRSYLQTKATLISSDGSDARMRKLALIEAPLRVSQIIQAFQTSNPYQAKLGTNHAKNSML